MRYRLGPWTPQGDSTQIGLPVKMVNAQPTVRGSYREINNFTLTSTSANLGVTPFPNSAAMVIAPLANGNISARNFFEMQIGGVGKIYEGVTDITGTVTSPTGATWITAANHYSNVDGAILGISSTQRLKYSASSGAALADLSASAPLARTVVAASDFLLAFEGANWYCSAIGNITDWTPSVATQAATGVIDLSSGQIIAAKTLAREVYLYKTNGIYRGQYAGPPTIWDWTLVTDKIGIMGNNAIVAIDNVHYFMSQDKFYVFDGSFPREIPGFAAIRQYVLFGEQLRMGNTATTGEPGRIPISGYQLFYNEPEDAIWILPSPFLIDAYSPYFYIYHIPTNLFGVGDLASLRSLGTATQVQLFQGYDLSYNSVGVLAVPASPGTSFSLFRRSYGSGITPGSLGLAEFQFGPYGAEDAISQLTRLRLIMYRVVGNVQVILYGSDKFHGTFVQYYSKTVDSATALLKFDSVVAGSAKRWHKITVKFSDAFEFDGFDMNIKTLSTE